MTPVKTVLHAAAQQLAITGVGTYKPDGIYTTGETGIILKATPPTPDRVVTLNAYIPGGDNPNPGAVTDEVMLQIRTRGLANPPTDVDDLAEAAVTALVGHHLSWPGLTVQRVHRLSTLPLGADQNRRQERTDNLRLLILR